MHLIGKSPDVYAAWRGKSTISNGEVFYQIPFTYGQLYCKARRKGSSPWVDFPHYDMPPTYHYGYAECPPWIRSTTSTGFDIKLELNGKEYFTDEETSVLKGPYPGSGRLHKT